MKDLVVLKDNDIVTQGNTTFKPNRFYRICEQGKGYIIYGEYFDKKSAETLFQEVNLRIGKDFKKVGLLGQYSERLTKTAFGKLADIHVYGKGRHAMKVLIFMSVDNGNKTIYGFFPNSGTRAEVIAESYNMYIDTCNGNMEHIDNGDIQFGNCGIPMSYGKLRVW